MEDFQKILRDQAWEVRSGQRTAGSWRISTTGGRTRLLHSSRSFPAIYDTDVTHSRSPSRRGGGGKGGDGQNIALRGRHARSVSAGAHFSSCKPLK